MAGFYRADLAQLQELREEVLKERHKSTRLAEDLEHSRRDVVWLRS